MKNRTRIAAAALAASVALSGAPSAFAADDDKSTKVSVPENMVSLVIPGIEIPGQPKDQILFPKLPSADQLRKDSAKLATQLDKLLIKFNKQVESQKKALADLNETERKLTDARNMAVAAIQEHGKSSDEAVDAKKQFTEVRNEVKDEAKSGDEEAKDALSDTDSKKKQKAASATNILKTRDSIAKTVDKADVDESKLTDPEQSDDGFIGSQEGQAYYNAEDTDSEDSSDKKNDEKKSDAKKSDKSEKNTKKKSSEDKLKERAERIFSPDKDDASESALYAYGAYKKPIGVPSLLSDEDKALYGDLASVDIRKILNEAIKQNAELKDSVKKLRQADLDGDNDKINEAKSELQPVVEQVAEMFYGWDDDADKSDKAYVTIVGKDGAPFDPNEDPEVQAKFENFVYDVLTTPAKFAKDVEKKNAEELKSADDDDSKSSDDK